MREVPVIAPLPKNGYWILLEDAVIRLNGKIFIVPKGFETDFASVPRVFWWLISPTDRTVIRASLLHDYLYRTENMEREKADYLFYLKLIEDGTPKWKAWLMWKAVRLFGRRAWKRYRDATEE